MKSRIIWIDLLKCMAIYTVVAGHMMSCEVFQSQIGLNTYELFIVSFHMPLFTILSGMFFSAEDNVGFFLKKKFIGILLPYIFWSFIWYFIKPLAELIISGSAIHASNIIWLTKFFLLDGLCFYGWWFLRGLFICFLFAYTSVKIANIFAQNHYLLGGLLSCIILYVLTFVGVIPNQIEKNSLLKGFIFMYPFFWTGYALRKLNSYADRFHIWHVAVVVFLFIILLLGWERTYSFYSMNTSALSSSGYADIVGWKVIYCTLYRYVIGVVGSLTFILVFCKLFSKKTDKAGLVLYQNIGKETLGIYILQSLVYWSLPNRDILKLGNVGNFIFSLVIAVIILAISYLIIRITAKGKYFGLVLWGKKLQK